MALQRYHAANGYKGIVLCTTLIHEASYPAH